MIEIFFNDLNVARLTAIVKENTYVNTFLLSIKILRKEYYFFFFYEEIDDFYKIQPRMNFHSMAH